MFGKTRFNFWLDVTIFIAFVITAFTGLLLWLVLPDGRGSGQAILLLLSHSNWVDLHNWTGLVMIVGVLTHLSLHWQWVSCVARRYLKKLAKQARVNFSLDALLLVAFLLTAVSGLVVWLVLPGGGHRGGSNPFYNAVLLGLTRHGWKELHLWAGLAMISIFGVHLALHWGWITCVVRRYAQTIDCQPGKRTPVQPG